MQKAREPFKIIVDGKVLDYRLGKELPLDKVRTYFEKQYTVEKLWSGGRHVLGILEKQGKTFFLKLATTEGISATTKNEYAWNTAYNKQISRSSSLFWVPVNYDCGYYDTNLFYMITDVFTGESLSHGLRETDIAAIIDFSETIQNLSPMKLPHDVEQQDYHAWFLSKTKSWYQGIPEDVRNTADVARLLTIVEHGIKHLETRPRHGDFTPWHMMRLSENTFGLFDGEHALSESVETYDICYFIQRVFSESKDPILAQDILDTLEKRTYAVEKIQTVLAARAIGGFLDASLAPDPDYTFARKFQEWIVSM